MRDPIADLMDLGFTEAHATLQSDRLQAAFAQIDRRVIAAMSDTELAVWHASFPIESPQAKLAEHEWQRRLTVMQVGAMRFATLGWTGWNVHRCLARCGRNIHSKCPNQRSAAEGGASEG